MSRRWKWLTPALALVVIGAPSCSSLNPSVGPLIDAAPPPPACTSEGSGEYGSGYGTDSEDAGDCDDGS